MTSSIKRLIEFGQSPWYDNLTRALATGGLATLVDEHGIRGVTSNPTIFEKAMASGNDYDAQLREVTAAGAVAPRRVLGSGRPPTSRHATDILRPHYEAWDGTTVSSRWRFRPTSRTTPPARSRRPSSSGPRIDRPNVMIKIPATEEGIPAIAAALDAGLNVNVTLIFSLAATARSRTRSSRGSSSASTRGDDISRIASVASFFVSRVDTETDRRLPEGHALRGKAAVANAKLAYQHFLATFSGPAVGSARGEGRARAAPAVGIDLDEEPGVLPDALRRHDDRPRHREHPRAGVGRRARGRRRRTCAPTPCSKTSTTPSATMAGLAAAGIDFDDVTATLEREGVAAFTASFQDAVETLEKKARELSPLTERLSRADHPSTRRRQPDEVQRRSTIWSRQRQAQHAAPRPWTAEHLHERSSSRHSRRREELGAARDGTRRGHDEDLRRSPDLPQPRHHLRVGVAPVGDVRRARRADSRVEAAVFGIT